MTFIIYKSSQAEDAVYKTVFGSPSFSSFIVILHHGSFYIQTHLHLLSYFGDLSASHTSDE